jgi:tetratricopeptide (TPR) repeat protein
MKRNKVFVSVALLSLWALSVHAKEAQKPSGETTVVVPSATVVQTAVVPSTAGVSDATAALAQLESVKRTNAQLAIQHWDTVLAKEPKNGEAYAKRGAAYGALHQYDKAIPDYAKALELKPDQKDVYVNRAVAYYFQGDYDKSWADVHKAESLHGEFWPAFMDGLKKASGKNK